MYSVYAKTLIDACDLLTTAADTTYIDTYNGEGRIYLNTYINSHKTLRTLIYRYTLIYLDSWHCTYGYILYNTYVSWFIHTSTHANLHTDMHYSHLPTQTRTYIDTYILLYIYFYIHTAADVHTYLSAPQYMAHTHPPTYVYISIYLHVYTGIPI